MTDVARLEKLLGMLGSSHDGERSNAAAFISRLANDNKLTIVEMVKQAFGNARSAYADSNSLGKEREEYWRTQFQKAHHDFNKADAARRAAEQKLKQYEAEQKQPPPKSGLDFNSAQPQPHSQHNLSAGALEEMVCRLSGEMLAPGFERTFIDNLMTRENWTNLSPKQRNKIAEIYCRYFQA